MQCGAAPLVYLGTESVGKEATLNWPGTLGCAIAGRRPGGGFPRTSHLRRWGLLVELTRNSRRGDLSRAHDSLNG